MWKTIFVLLIILPIGIAVAIFFTYAPTFKWSKLSNEEKNLFNNAKVNFYGVDVRFRDLFANNSEIYDQLPSDHIKLGLEGNYLELSEVIYSTYKQKIFLTYLNMTKNLKENLVTRKVNFQGEKVKFRDILTNLEVLNSLNCSEIRETFEGNLIKISSPTEIEIKFFLERAFIGEEIEIEKWSHYTKGDINFRHRDVKKSYEIELEVARSKILILSNPAGDGKTETFKHFAMRLKKSSPANWIQFVDLKKHFNAFKKGTKINFYQKNALLKFLTSNILHLNKLEGEIFLEYFNSGRITFLWDGFDEISPLYKDPMLKLISAVKSSSGCLQFISTRPQFSKDLRERLNVPAYKLMQIGKLSRFEFMTKMIAGNFDKNPSEYWDTFISFLNGSLNTFMLMKDSTNSSALKFYQENENIFLLLEKSQKVIESIEKSDRNEKLITNPLLLRMISEILGDEDSHFDENVTFNFFSIYDAFVDKKLEITREKGKTVDKDVDNILKKSTVNLMQVHQAYALKQIFSYYLKVNGANFTTSDLQIMKSISKLSSSETSRLGILDVRSETDFTFVHQTFAEFLVARFLIDIFEDFDLTNSESDSHIKIYLLNSVLYSGKLQLVRNFVVNYAVIENETPKFFEALKYLPLREFSKILDKKLQNISQFDNFKTIFGTETRNVKVFDYYDQLKNLIDENFQQSLDMKRVLLSKGERGFSLLSEVIDNDESTEFLEPYLEVNRKVFNKTEILSLIYVKEGDFDETPLMLAAQWKKKLKDFKIFWHFLDENFEDEEKRGILLTKSKYSWTAFQYAAQSKDPNIFLFMKDIYERLISQDEIRGFLMNIDKDYSSYIKVVIYSASLETVHEVSNYLLKLFANRTVELTNILTHRDWNGDSVFSWFKYREEDENFDDKLKIFIKLLKTTYGDSQKQSFGAFLNELSTRIDENVLHATEPYNVWQQIFQTTPKKLFF
jgi:hypothetical protein